MAVDGGIFVRYGFYRELLREGVRDILGDAVAAQVRIGKPSWLISPNLFLHFYAPVQFMVRHCYMRRTCDSWRPALRVKGTCIFTW